MVPCCTTSKLEAVIFFSRLRFVLFQRLSGTPLMKIRKTTGLHARSRVDIHEARRGLYAANIDGQVAVKLGPHSWSPGAGWKLALDGERFAVWTRSH